LYTGRGPVCGTIIRGGGACVRAVGSLAVGDSTAAGPVDTVLAGAADCVEADDEGAVGCAATGACVVAELDALCGAFGAAGGGTVKVGLTGVVGTTNFGAGGAGAGGTTDTGALEEVLGGVAFVSTGGGTTAGRGGAVVPEAAGVCCLLMMAFRTSPGREIFDKSILVFISSDSGRLARDDLLAGCASLVARKWARTFSASKSSMELEWVFFSVTPTAVSASRIALLFTSSSLARSLIRILLIRPFFPPDCPAKPS
jgi:hypothetical protein